MLKWAECHGTPRSEGFCFCYAHPQRVGKQRLHAVPHSIGQDVGFDCMRSCSNWYPRMDWLQCCKEKHTFLMFLLFLSHLNVLDVKKIIIDKYKVSNSRKLFSFFFAFINGENLSKATWPYVYRNTVSPPGNSWLICSFWKLRLILKLSLISHTLAWY